MSAWFARVISSLIERPLDCIPDLRSFISLTSWHSFHATDLTRESWQSCPLFPSQWFKDCLIETSTETTTQTVPSFFSTFSVPCLFDKTFRRSWVSLLQELRVNRRPTSLLLQLNDDIFYSHHHLHSRRKDEEGQVMLRVNKHDVSPTGSLTDRSIICKDQQNVTQESLTLEVALKSSLLLYSS